MMKTLMLLIAFMCSNLLAVAEDSIYVWTKNRSIEWTDFLGRVNDSSDYDAETFAEVCYKYNFSKGCLPKFEVFATFNKYTSWSKFQRQTKSLLKHEQLHFDIAQLYAIKLEKRFLHYKYTANFASEVREIFNAVKAEYHFMQMQCDEATNHSLNKEKQADWEAYVNNELQRADGFAILTTRKGETNPLTSSP